MNEDFDTFFHRTYARTMARAIMQSGSRADAEDAVAVAYANIAGRWHTIETPEAYLHVTVTRAVVDIAKKRRRQEEVAGLELPGSRYATPEQAYEASQVLAAIAGLPPMQRTVLVSYCLHGMEQKAIAKLLRITRGAVAAHLHQARENLARRLGRELATTNAGDALVSGPARRELRPATDDGLVEQLREVEWWLADMFEADDDTKARVRADVDAIASDRPRGRWGRREA